MTERTHVLDREGRAIEVDYWPTVTPGLVLTPAQGLHGPLESRWVITHEPSGLCLGIISDSPEALARAAGDLNVDAEGAPLDWVEPNPLVLERDERYAARVVMVRRERDLDRAGGPKWCAITGVNV